MLCYVMSYSRDLCQLRSRVKHVNMTLTTVGKLWTYLQHNDHLLITNGDMLHCMSLQELCRKNITETVQQSRLQLGWFPVIVGTFL